MTKRGNKEGTIYKRPNGKWRAQIFLNGGRLSHTANTRSEAQDWLRNTANHIDNGLTLKGARTTYGDFLAQWLQTGKSRLAPTTFYSYEQLIRSYVRPMLGKARLRDLTPNLIQRFYNQMGVDGVGARTIQKAHTVIHSSLNAAVKLGLIGRNPDDATQPPKSIPKEKRFLNRSEVKRFLQTARQTQVRNYALYFTAISTGLREGELLGLRWEDVELETGVLRVNNNLVRLPGGSLCLQRPKTKSSIRSVKLGKETIRVLREQKGRLLREKSKIENLWQETGHVFPSTVGTPMDPTNLYRQFKLLRKEVGIPNMRFHDLRHTAASLMLNNGVDVLVASRRLGHAKPSITLDVYGHLIPSLQKDVAEVLDELIA